ncbi:MAG TPA: CDP-archaeol synthase [Stellaceae bacterium]|nr:CDP-archaeol synthase [Stellaceae bacterium]
MNPRAVVQLLILLAAANGAPVIGRRLLRDRFAWPLDGGVCAFDGRPLLGPSKSVRGIVLALVATAAVAPLVGLTPTVGITVAAIAMAGDLISSFIKRRFGLQSSSRAVGLDQVPESLLPALACWHTLMLDVGDIVAVTAIFFIGEIALSRLLYHWRIRERPY